MPAPQISPLPTPPSRSQSPETFSTDADTFLGALPEFQTDANAQADYLDALAIDVTADVAAAEAAVVDAETAAAIAAGAANYQGDYNAGTTYQIGESVSYNSYRWVAKTVNTGVTPAAGANWFQINDGDVLGPNSATTNSLAIFDGTTGKLLKSPLGNGTLGALLSSGGSGNAPAFLDQGTTGQVLTSAGSGSAPTWSTISPAGSFTAVASGALTSGQTVVLNSDGTVTAVSGTNATAGSATVFSSSNSTNMIGAGYDPINQKVLVAYSNGAGRSLAVVGTVSGTAITFGTPVDFGINSGSQIIVIYEATTAQFVLIYTQWNGSNYGTTVRVGAVSGTTITFGSATGIYLMSGYGYGTCAAVAIGSSRVLLAAYASNAMGMMCLTISSLGFSAGSQGVNLSGGTFGFSSNGLAWDSVNSRYVLCYTNTSYGTRISMGSVTGTTLAEIANVQVAVASSEKQAVTSCYHVASGKTVITYGTGTSCFVNTVSISGSSVTFGGSVALSGSSGLYTKQAYDSTNQRNIVVFDGGGVVKSSSIYVNGGAAAVTSAVTIASTTPTWLGLAFDDAAQAFVSVYMNASNSNYGTAIVAKAESSNIKDKKFAGFSSSSYSNGQTATINSIGSSNSSVSGLTPGSQYYVQADGSLGLTPSALSTAYAGLALSATEILVKG